MRSLLAASLGASVLTGMLVGLAPLPAIAQPAFNVCGELGASFGPFDYRTADAGTKRVVESVHFTPGVEALIGGATGSLGGDLAYTLRVFPNHHRALIAMMNLGQKLKASMAPGAGYSVDCFFDRALRFRSEDAIVRMIYAKYLSGYGRKPEAIKQLERAAELETDNGFTQYNVGLVYLEINEFDQALAQAHIAMSLGFERTALKERLVAAKRWREPIGSVAQAGAGSSAAASAPASASASASR